MKITLIIQKISIFKLLKRQNPDWSLMYFQFRHHNTLWIRIRTAETFSEGRQYIPVHLTMAYLLHYSLLPWALTQEAADLRFKQDLAEQDYNPCLPLPRRVSQPLHCRAVGGITLYLHSPAPRSSSISHAIPIWCKMHTQSQTGF